MDIYRVKQEMGHASVTTTEVYAQFSLRRLTMDFPNIIEKSQQSDSWKNGHEIDGHNGTFTVGRPVAF